MICLRPHHGMCLAYFEGKGYSDGFTVNMQKMLEFFEKGADIELTVSGDEICKECPNLKEGSGWVIDKNASTKERTILYYTGILPAGESTPALSDTLTIDGSIATKVKQDVTEKDGYKTITTTYAYDGYNFQLEAEADAVQTHNAQDAIKSAWGVDVDVDGNGNISLR